MYILAKECLWFISHIIILDLVRYCLSVIETMSNCLIKSFFFY